MNVAQVLETSADYIEQYGLAKGTGLDGFTACAWGAIRISANSAPIYIEPSAKFHLIPTMTGLRLATQAAETLMSFLGFSIREPNGKMSIGKLFDWNDSPSRTQGEVIAAMRGAAAVWRAQQAIGAIAKSEPETVAA